MWVKDTYILIGIKNKHILTWFVHSNSGPIMSQRLPLPFPHCSTYTTLIEISYSPVHFICTNLSSQFCVRLYHNGPRVIDLWTLSYSKFISRVGLLFFTLLNMLFFSILQKEDSVLFILFLIFFPVWIHLKRWKN